MSTAIPGMPTKRPPGWREIIGSGSGRVRARDPAACNTVEISVTRSGVHAVLKHHVANRRRLSGQRLPARLSSWWARVTTNADVHPGARIGLRLLIDHAAGVTIGELRSTRVRHRIDARSALEHHLIPDPVEVLIDRIEFLKARLAHMQRRNRTSADTTCSDCDKDNTP